jgi:hypothetical protein
MSEQSASTKQGDDEQGESPQARQRSGIAFPYNNFGDVEKIIMAIHNHAGTASCSMGQLAVWTGQSAKSSGFRMQVAAARMFTVVEGSGESLRLTTLGKQVADPMTARKAKAEAFLAVPLFSALYQSHKDQLLPPAAALEREIAELGVPVKQKDRARQVFERSADDTGFFEFGKGRLVMPAIKDGGQEKSGGKSGKGGSDGGDGGDGKNDLGLDPLLMALLRKIPKTGEPWPKEQRIRWFKTFAMNVSQVYDDDANQPVELSITEAPGSLQ